jgi:hypothetical protein
VVGWMIAERESAELAELLMSMSMQWPNTTFFRVP